MALLELIYMKNLAFIQDIVKEYHFKTSIRYRWSVEDFFRVMKQDIGIEKIMVRTLRRINKLIEIAILAYAVAFKVLMIGGNLVAAIIEAGGKLGIKSKNEDTVGRVLKGLANVVLLL